MSDATPQPEEEPAAETALPKRRQLGALRGKIWMAPDFDEWPEDILAAMEGAEDDPPNPP